MTGLLPPLATYDACYAEFRWRIPKHFNIAAAVCDRHAAVKPDAPAVLFEDADGETQVMTFGQLRAQANRLANVLHHLTIQPGDRVAIHLPQSFEAAFAHIAIYKLGAIALPLFSLFGPDALRHRLADSSARVMITCEDNLPVLNAVRDDLGELAHVLVTDRHGSDGLPAQLRAASDTFETTNTRTDDPAMLIHTSGTTGDPKGALQAHRGLIGHLPGVEFPHRYLPTEARPALDPSRLGLGRRPA